MSALKKIDKYFKELQHKKPKLYNKRISSFEQIIEAINLGNIDTINRLIEKSIQRFGNGMLSNRYANLLYALYLEIQKKGLESLKLKAKEISFENSYTLEIESVPLQSIHRKTPGKADNQHHESFFKNAIIMTMLNLLEKYIEESEAKLSNAKESMKEANANSSITSYGLELIKQHTATGFFKSGIKIDLKLTKDKIELAEHLKFDLLELEADWNSEEHSVEDAARSLVFSLLLAIDKNNLLSNDAVLGSKGDLGRLLNAGMSMLRRYYSKSTDVAITFYSDYKDDLLSPEHNSRQGI